MSSWAQQQRDNAERAARQLRSQLLQTAGASLAGGRRAEAARAHEASAAVQAALDGVWRVGETPGEKQQLAGAYVASGDDDRASSALGASLAGSYVNPGASRAAEPGLAPPRRRAEVAREYEPAAELPRPVPRAAEEQVPPGPGDGDEIMIPDSSSDSSLSSGEVSPRAGREAHVAPAAPRTPVRPVDTGAATVRTPGRIAADEGAPRGSPARFAVGESTPGSARRMLVDHGVFAEASKVGSVTIMPPAALQLDTAEPARVRKTHNIYMDTLRKWRERKDPDDGDDMFYVARAILWVHGVAGPLDKEDAKEAAKFVFPVEGIALATIVDACENPTERMCIVVLGMWHLLRTRIAPLDASSDGDGDFNQKFDDMRQKMVSRLEQVGARASLLYLGVVAVLMIMFPWKQQPDDAWNDAATGLAWTPLVFKGMLKLLEQPLAEGDGFTVLRINKLIKDGLPVALKLKLSASDVAVLMRGKLGDGFVKVVDNALELNFIQIPRLIEKVREINGLVNINLSDWIEKTGKAVLSGMQTTLDGIHLDLDGFGGDFTTLSELHSEEHPRVFSATKANYNLVAEDETKKSQEMIAKVRGFFDRLYKFKRDMQNLVQSTDTTETKKERVNTLKGHLWNPIAATDATFNELSNHIARFIDGILDQIEQQPGAPLSFTSVIRQIEGKTPYLEYLKRWVRGTPNYTAPVPYDAAEDVLRDAARVFTSTDAQFNQTKYSDDMRVGWLLLSALVMQAVPTRWNDPLYTTLMLTAMLGGKVGWDADTKEKAASRFVDETGAAVLPAPLLALTMWFVYGSMENLDTVRNAAERTTETDYAPLTKQIARAFMAMTVDVKKTSNWAREKLSGFTADYLRGITYDDIISSLKIRASTTFAETFVFLATEPPPETAPEPPKKVARLRTLGGRDTPPPGPRANGRQALLDQMAAKKNAESARGSPGARAADEAAPARTRAEEAASPTQIAGSSVRPTASGRARRPAGNSAAGAAKNEDFDGALGKYTGKKLDDTRKKFVAAVNKIADPGAVSTRFWADAAVRTNLDFFNQFDNRLRTLRGLHPTSTSLVLYLLFPIIVGEFSAGELNTIRRKFSDHIANDGTEVFLRLLAMALRTVSQPGKRIQRIDSDAMKRELADVIAGQLGAASTGVIVGYAKLKPLFKDRTYPFFFNEVQKIPNVGRDGPKLADLRDILCADPAQ